MKLSEPCNKTHMICGHSTISTEDTVMTDKLNTLSQVVLNFQPSQHASTNTILQNV